MGPVSRIVEVPRVIAELLFVVRAGPTIVLSLAARRILPFRVGRKSVRLLRTLVQLSNVHLDVLPRDILDGTHISAVVVRRGIFTHDADPLRLSDRVVK